MSVAESYVEPWIPEDTFALRLMAVRQHAGWTNVEKAAKACEITGQTWRNWEAGTNTPRDALAVCRKIADVAGCDAQWLAFGGPLPRSRCSSPLTLVTGYQPTLPGMADAPTLSPERANLTLVPR